MRCAARRARSFAGPLGLKSIVLRGSAIHIVFFWRTLHALCFAFRLFVRRQRTPTTNPPPASQPGAYEVQTLGCNSNATGNFTVTFRGQTTSPINPLATAQEVRKTAELDLAAL
jgi:hypothetical protein